MLILPISLQHEQDRFLDDLTLEQVQETLGVPVLPVENDLLSCWQGCWAAGKENEKERFY